MLNKSEENAVPDPESGWFYIGKHKQVFAYSVETACDKNGWILNNVHNLA